MLLDVAEVGASAVRAGGHAARNFKLTELAHWRRFFSIKRRGQMESFQRQENGSWRAAATRANARKGIMIALKNCRRNKS